MIWMEEGCKGRKERKGRKGKEGKEGREGRKRGKGGKEGRKGKARKGKERKGRKEKEGKEGKEGKEKKGREGRKGRKGRGRRKGPLACGQWVGRTARARVCGWAGGRRGDVKRWKRGAHAPGLRLLSRETRSTVSTVGGVVGEMRPSLSPSLGGEAVAVDASLGSHSARIRLSVNHSAIACRSTSRLPRSARSARARSSANLCSSAACVCCVRAGSRKVGRAVRKSVDRSSIARRWCDACRTLHVVHELEELGLGRARRSGTRWRGRHGVVRGTEELDVEHRLRLPQHLARRLQLVLHQRPAAPRAVLPCVLIAVHHHRRFRVRLCRGGRRFARALELLLSVPGIGGGDLKGGGRYAGEWT